MGTLPLKVTLRSCHWWVSCEVLKWTEKLSLVCHPWETFVFKNTREQVPLLFNITPRSLSLEATLKKLPVTKPLFWSLYLTWKVASGQSIPWGYLRTWRNFPLLDSFPRRWCPRVNLRRSLRCLVEPGTGYCAETMLSTSTNQFPLT